MESRLREGLKLSLPSSVTVTIMWAVPGLTWQSLMATYRQTVVVVVVVVSVSGEGGRTCMAAYPSSILPFCRT